MTYDVIVIGAGAMGSAAAYYLSKAGQKVLLLEQFEIDHKYGSSYGYSRIIRYSYDDTRYIDLAKAAYPLWFALEEESGETLYTKTGGIDFGKVGELTLQETIDSVNAANIPHELLDAAEGMRRFPQFHFDDDMQVLYQAETGMLKASKCVTTHIKLAHNATVMDHTPVTSITIHEDSIDVTTDKEAYSAGKLIVTAGAWMARLMAQTGIDLPLQPLRCQPMFFRPTNEVNHSAGAMPIFIFHRGGNIHDAVYGIPDHDNVGVKAAFHGGQEVNHPSEVNYTPDSETVEAVRAINRHYIPGIAEGELLESRICLYTMTPDLDFIIDHHPQHKHVIVAGGFSGHGFKFSTLIGSILSDLALEGSTEHDLSLFKVLRFV